MYIYTCICIYIYMAFAIAFAGDNSGLIGPWGPHGYAQRRSSASLCASQTGRRAGRQGDGEAAAAGHGPGPMGSHVHNMRIAHGSVYIIYI